MKRIFSVLCILSLLMCLIGCSSKAKSTVDGSLTEVSTIYDQYGNILQQTLYNEDTAEYYLKEFSYSLQNGKWVCVDQSLTLIQKQPAINEPAEAPLLRVFHVTDINRKPVVIIDNEKVRISIVQVHDAEYWYRFAYDLKVENKTDKVISIFIENASILGIGCPPLFSIDHIEPGYSTYFTLGWDNETLSRYYIPYIDNVEFMVTVRDNSNWDAPAYAGERVLIKHD